LKQVDRRRPHFRIKTQSTDRLSVTELDGRADDPARAPPMTARRRKRSLPRHQSNWSNRPIMNRPIMDVQACKRLA
jgi:hypothetical protein